jgi:hypothetical protein
LPLATRAVIATTSNKTPEWSVRTWRSASAVRTRPSVPRAPRRTRPCPTATRAGCPPSPDLRDTETSSRAQARTTMDHLPHPLLLLLSLRPRRQAHATRWRTTMRRPTS